jgi:hypothetical protein
VLIGEDGYTVQDRNLLLRQGGQITIHLFNRPSDVVRPKEPPFEPPPEGKYLGRAQSPFNRLGGPGQDMGAGPNQPPTAGHHHVTVRHS